MFFGSILVRYTFLTFQKTCAFSAASKEVTPTSYVLVWTKNDLSKKIICSEGKQTLSAPFEEKVKTFGFQK